MAVDLGSNTCRAIEYDCATRSFGRECDRIVKTADNMHKTGRISEGAIERVVTALKEADALFGLRNVTVRAVTTAAMRMASNREEALEQIEAETGVRFEVIDADREAYYTLLAVRARLSMLAIPDDSLAMIDVGGGSTELIFYRDGKRVSESFPIGIVTVAQQCATPGEVRLLLNTLMRPVKAFAERYAAAEGSVETFVATAGTPTTMAAYLQGMTYETYNASAINGYRLSRADCDKALRELLAMDETTRARVVGVGRETLIVAGVVIVQAFYDVLGFDEAVVIDDGVREGVAIDYCLRLHRHENGPDS